MVLALFIAAAITDTQTTAQTLYKKAQAAVVTVNTPTAAGTGFFVGDGSLILTCHHVIRRDPTHVTVTGFGHATVVRFSSDTDVALLRVSRRSSNHLSIAVGNAPSPGAQVFVIGSPLGVLDKSITEGTLSGVRHEGNAALLQITAPISHGSSGSPVMDKKGLVIGMAAGTLEQGQGLNFAISAFNLRSVLASGAKTLTSSANWKPDLAVVCVRPTTAWTATNSEAEECASMRRAQVLVVAKTKNPAWYTIRAVDGSLAYVPVSDTRPATKAEIKAGNPSVHISAEVLKICDQLEKVDGIEAKRTLAKKLKAYGEKVIPMLAYRMRTPAEDGYTRVSLALGFAVFEDAAGDAILKMFADGNRYERQGAVLALASMAFWPADQQTQKPTERISQFLNRPDIVHAIVAGLDDVATQDISCVLIGHLQMKAGNEKLIGWLESEEDALIEKSITTLAYVAEPGDQAKIYDAAFHLVSAYIEDQDAEKKLAKDAESTEDENTNYLVSSLFDRLCRARTDIGRKVIADFLDDPRVQVRYLACASILDAGDDANVPAVESLIKDVSPVVRSMALLASVTLRGGGYSDQIIAASKADSAEERWAAACCLEYNHEADVMAAVFALAVDKDVDVRTSLADSLAFVSGSRARFTLDNLARDPEPSVRKAAKEALPKQAKLSGG